MIKGNYLADEHVSSFITWLSNDLVNRNFHLQVAISQFAPNGENEWVTGVENALNHFVWRSRWTDLEGAQPVLSDDWATTTASLDRLKQGLVLAMAANDEAATCVWCENILDWGGVSGAIAFLRAKRDNDELIEYLTNAAPLFQLDDDELDLETIDDTRIHRFDAGLTKIHSVLDDSGSPIYDSRVGATISMFVALYCQQHNLNAVPQTLRFPTGQARGRQFRNPRDLGFPSAPALYSSFSGAKWAQCMVRLGWIMQKVVNAADLFNNLPNMRERLISMQGAFFMLGYDLRCFFPEEPDVQNGVLEPVQNNLPDEERHGNCVPTGFSADRVAQLFAGFLAADPELPCNSQEFIAWQMAHGGVANRNTARANCYPLTLREFDLFNTDQAKKEGFIQGGEAGLLDIVRDRVPAPNERNLVCLEDCYYAGILADRTPTERVEWLRTRRCANGKNGANTLLNVGRSVGRHFDLIDPEGQPTPAFYRFYIGRWVDGYEF